MSGEYKTTKRSLQQPIKALGASVWSDLHQTRFDTVDPISARIPTQETYSFRTSRNDDGDGDALDTTVTRNGFKTFDPQYDKGHTFWSTKQSYDYSAPEVFCRYKYQGTNWWYRGKTTPYLADPYHNSYPENNGLTANDVIVMGQRAINSTAPTKPQANVAQFVGELLADVPSMVGMAVLESEGKRFLGLGGEFLNIQFGWLPFISDLQKIVRSLSTVNKQILQLQRDNGRNVRRRFRFPQSVTTSTRSFQPIGSRYISAGGSTGTLTEQFSDKTFDEMVRTERDVWFSGCFTYHIPMDNNLIGRLERFDALANAVLGTRITPELLWELAPWSWLIDWKLSIGSALSTATRFSSDDLVIRYGYLMAHTKVTRYVSTRAQNLDLGLGPVHFPSTLISLRTERKERFRATPYGFGLNTAAFTDVQWAILAALGMTNSPRNLHLL